MGLVLWIIISCSPLPNFWIYELIFYKSEIGMIVMTSTEY